jgi:steroid 5-alpha reductase family enzyme
MREKFGKHFWWLSYFTIFLPAMSMNFLIGCVIYAFANAPKANISHISYWSGISMMLGGALFAAIADIQKYHFSTAKKNEGRVVDVGLWALSRHPNYLGEVVFWWGAFLVNFSAGILWTVISPIVLTMSVLFITGIPQVEKNMHEQYGQKYEEYARRVPVFFPIPFFGAGAKQKGMATEKGERSPQQRSMDQGEQNRAKVQ